MLRLNLSYCQRLKPLLLFMQEWGYSWFPCNRPSSNLGIPRMACQCFFALVFPSSHYESGSWGFLMVMQAQGNLNRLVTGQPCFAKCFLSPCTPCYSNSGIPRIARQLFCCVFVASSHHESGSWGRPPAMGLQAQSYLNP